MKTHKYLGLILIIFFAFSFAVSGQDLRNAKILRHMVYNYDSSDICSDKECQSLVGIRYITEEYRVMTYNGEYRYGSRMYAQYNVESDTDIEDYAFVQFMRGIVYKSDTTTGKAIRLPNTPNFEKLVPSSFRELTMDSPDANPIYGSSKNGNFEAGVRNIQDLHMARDEYSWDKKGFPNKNEPFYGVFDTPQMAFKTANIATNTMLYFKTCLYLMSDIENNDFENPLHCHEWTNWFEYDKDENAFRHYSLGLLPAKKK